MRSKKLFISAICLALAAVATTPVAGASQAENSTPTVSHQSGEDSEKNQINSEMATAFGDIEAVGETLSPGESEKVGTFREWDTYVTKSASGEVSIALGEPKSQQQMVQARGVCGFAVSAALIAVGTAVVAGLIMTAPIGATAITVAGVTVPMSVAQAFVAAGGITTAVNTAIQDAVCGKG